MSTRVGAAVALLGVLVFSGCSFQAPSDNAFAFKDPTTAIVKTADGASLEISGTLLNSSSDVLDNVRVTLILDNSLGPYVETASAENYSLVPFDDIYPDDTSPSAMPPGAARGFDLEYSLPLVSTDPRAIAKVFDHADTAIVRVTWSGGEQDLTFSTAVQDPDGLRDE